VLRRLPAAPERPNPFEHDGAFWRARCVALWRRSGECRLLVRENSAPPIDY
jgi:hypothetical protein